MPKVTVRTEIACPVERVWRLVTDLKVWDWRSDLNDLRVSRDGMSFYEYEWDGERIFYEIRAFAPCYWFACDMMGRGSVGRWELFFTRSGAETKLEAVAELQRRDFLTDLRALVWLRRKLKQYVVDLRLELEAY